MSYPITAFLPANMDGCALYRQYIPHLNLERSRFVFAADPKVGVQWEQFSEAEVVVVQRQVSKENYDAMMQMKGLGLKIIYDTDDNLWALPAANPMARMFREYQLGFERCAMIADAITVSTKGLRTAVRTALPRFGKEILICPNAMDFNLFGRMETTKEDGRVVIGWAGSNTHGEDLGEAWAVLPKLMERNANLYMEFIGMPPPWALNGHPRVRLRRFYPVGEYPSRLASWGWDVTLAPLVDNRFNRSKSNIKMLEAAALGIPCLVSPVQPYEEFCALHPDLRGLLCYNENQWLTKLEELVREPDRRRLLAQRMDEVARKWFNIQGLNQNWIHAIESAVGN